MRRLRVPAGLTLLLEGLGQVGFERFLLVGELLDFLLDLFELVLGALLVLGLKPRSCLLLIQALLVIFMIVLAVTMLRGLNIDCGCGLFSERQVGFLAMLEDGLLLALAAWLYFVELNKLLPPR